MSDYADLLARLDGPPQVSATGKMVLAAERLNDAVATDYREAAAAIRSLIAERDAAVARCTPLPSIQSATEALRAAVLAEREACAVICDAAAVLSNTLWIGSDMRGYKSNAVNRAESCAEEIRARGNADG